MRRTEADEMSMSLLVADDDSDHLDLTRLILEEGLPGCAISTAETGQGVLDALDGRSFDVVLLDYCLPDLDGLQVLEELRRRIRPAPVVILLTGLGSEDVAAAAFRLGADDYLTKDRDDLLLLPTVVERALQRRRLQQLEREIEAQRAIERNKLAFLHSINHELRTPLTMIVGYAELLARQTCSPDEIPAYCQEIFAHASRLSELVERLLEAAMAEPTRSSGTAAIRPTNLAEIVRQAVAAAESLPRRRTRLEAPGEAPALIDPVLFRRALDEVIGNALKFSPPTAEVLVSVVAVADAVQVTVSDHGPGIPDEEREQVFLAFYRIENESAITVRGLGLGLSRVRQIVLAQGGEITIDDAPWGSGTSVRMSFRSAGRPADQMPQG